MGRWVTGIRVVLIRRGSLGAVGPSMLEMKLT
jgi:hypothetical protein